MTNSYYDFDDCDYNDLKSWYYDNSDGYYYDNSGTYYYNDLLKIIKKKERNMFNILLRNTANKDVALAERNAMERKMRMQIAKDMAFVLTSNDGRRMKWNASKTDLMEALHWTFMNDTLANYDGSPCRFCTLVERACTAFGMTVPRNPRRTVTRACARMGVRNATLCRRCCIIAQAEKTEHPLLRLITFS